MSLRGTMTVELGSCYSSYRGSGDDIVQEAASFIIRCYCCCCCCNCHLTIAWIEYTLATVFDGQPPNDTRIAPKRVHTLRMQPFKRRRIWRKELWKVNAAKGVVNHAVHNENFRAFRWSNTLACQYKAAAVVASLSTRGQSRAGSHVLCQRLANMTAANKFEWPANRLT